MLDWLKHLLKKEPETIQETQPPIIITIHGYGRRRKHEFDNLALWGKNDGLDIVQFDMYDLFDEEDHDWMQWVSRAKEVVDTYKHSGRDIYLIGFSMGGVIASYLATVCSVKKLILLAPAFSYMNMDMITGVISKSASSLWSNEKKEEIQLPRSFYSAFMELVKNLKKYISFVDCPVFIIHGDQDEVISVKSSLWAYDKIPHKQKKMIMLHEGHHRLFMDEAVNWECYQNILLFVQDRIITIPPVEQAEDIMEELLHKKRALDAEKAKEIQNSEEESKDFTETIA